MISESGTGTGTVLVRYGTGTARYGTGTVPPYRQGQGELWLKEREGGLWLYGEQGGI